MGSAVTAAGSAAQSAVAAPARTTTRTAAPWGADGEDVGAGGEGLLESVAVVGVQQQRLVLEAPDQGVGRALGQQAPVVEQADALAAGGLVHVGRGDDDGHALVEELVQQVPELAAADGVDAVGRLVEQQHARLVQERAGEGELLVHAAGQRVGAAVAEAGQARDVEKALLAGAHRGGGQAEEVAEKPEVLVDAEVAVEAVLLGHVAEGFEGLGGAGRDELAADEGGAGVGDQEAREHADGGGLAGAVGAHEAVELARAEREGQTAHGRGVAEAAREGAGFDGEAGGRGGRGRGGLAGPKSHGVSGARCPGW
jgi:hypothetical protein